MEIWKSVIGYEDYYEVSNYGIVKRLSKKIQIGNRNVLFNGKVMIPLDNGKGYLRVKLSKNNKPKRVMLHRIIAEAFIENPNNYKTVNHKDGNKLNNSIENLEWCTQSENCIHAIKNGLKSFEYAKIGISVKCTVTGVKYASITEAAIKFGTTQSNICHCLNGRTKKHKGYEWKYKKDFNA